MGPDIAYMGSTSLPVQSLKLYEQAKQDEPDFMADIGGTPKTGGVVFGRRSIPGFGSHLKKRESSERKMRDELNNDPTLLRDVLRATTTYDTIEKSRLAASQFIADHEGQVERVKDRFVTQNHGYRDILINYRLPSGLVAEVQFNGDDMIKAKFGEGHRYYEMMRLLRAGHLPESFGASGDPKMLIEQWEQESDAIYNAAYQKDGNGHWGRA